MVLEELGVNYKTEKSNTKSACTCTNLAVKICGEGDGETASCKNNYFCKETILL